MTPTVDEARASLLAAYHDDPDDRTFHRYLDALIAAVRAESPEWRVEAWRKQALAAEAKLAPLREAAAEVDRAANTHCPGCHRWPEVCAGITRREPLDVERLGQAAENVNRRVLVLGGHVEQAAYGEMIAAEYARLEAADKPST